MFSSSNLCSMCVVTPGLVHGLELLPNYIISISSCVLTPGFCYGLQLLPGGGGGGEFFFVCIKLEIKQNQGKNGILFNEVFVLVGPPVLIHTMPSALLPCCVVSCLALPCPAGPAPSCPPCLALPAPALPMPYHCPSLPCPALSCPVPLPSPPPPLPARVITGVARKRERENVRAK
jgi:hypothetical protein